VIVLDEHLQDPDVAQRIGRWYRGQIRLVTELRPGSIIKDDAIPVILRTVAQPTFITINVTDFWQQTAPHSAFCIVCLALDTDDAGIVSELVRRLFRLVEFQTRASRCGKVARVSSDHVIFRETGSEDIIARPLPGR
jgi:hypothetical protein